MLLLNNSKFLKRGKLNRSRLECVEKKIKGTEIPVQNRKDIYVYEKLERSNQLVSSSICVSTGRFSTICCQLGRFYKKLMTLVM